MRKVWTTLAVAFVLVLLVGAAFPVAAEASDGMNLSEFAGGVSTDTLWGVGAGLMALFVIWAMLYYLNRE